MTTLNQKKNVWENILNAYVLIAILIVVSAVVTYVVPAGTYERVVDAVTNKTVIDPQSFQFVENTPVGVMDTLLSIPRGMQEAGSIIFFVFIVAGAFEVLNRTGFTEAFVNVTLRKFAGKEKILFPIVVTVLSFFAATMGMAEEVVIFIPILLALSKSLGYDELVAAGLAYCGIRAGHINGMMNPFNVGIAQSFAELPLYSGLWYRSIWCVITIAATSVILWRYAVKIKADPTKSLMYGVNQDWDTVDLRQLENSKFTRTHKILGVALLAVFALIIFGVMKYGWYLDEIAALFLAFGVAVGLIARFQVSDIAEQFLSGARSVLAGALVIGMARGILVVLQEGQIIDTIVYYAAELLSGTPKVIAANGMYVFQWLLNLIIPSGSAQAATTMPIMTPIADVLGINRQVAVTAFHYGDGVTNLLTPACGPLMTCIALAKVPYIKWLKWVVPMLIAWTLIGFAAVTGAQLINLGPF
ncbi:YfcC family protein [Bacilliculturomica massiliensis]|uniref:YfcC family protein n=1 Tax=Bacilliculturomica massiliensis TaxID=1917867 RepID=UPI001032504C|nr:SLC13 family permease [Bacilliculturomica massiliensis]